MSDAVTLRHVMRSADAAEIDRGRTLHYEMLPLFRALFLETNPIPIKTAAALIGLCSDEMRLPLAPLSGENLAHMEEVLETMPQLLPTPEEA